MMRYQLASISILLTHDMHCVNMFVKGNWILVDTHCPGGIVQGIVPPHTTATLWDSVELIGGRIGLNYNKLCVEDCFWLL